MRSALCRALYLAVPEVVLLLLIMWVCGLSHAQTQDNAPHVYQSCIHDALAFGSGCSMPFDIRSGDMIVCGGDWDTQASLTSITIVNTNSRTGAFTMEPAVLGRLMSLGQFQQAAQMGFAVATGSGPENFFPSVGYPRLGSFVCVEISPPTGGFTFDSHNEGPGGNGNNSINVTTTAQNDTLVCMYSTPDLPNSTFTASPAQGTFVNQFAASSWGRWPMMMSLTNVGASGTNTCSFVPNGNDYTLPSVIAFKPSTLSISTTVLPDGGKGTAYQATLKANGGSGAFTWSISAGSCGGLSMSAGGVLSGTPTTAASCTITAQVTDGSTTKTQAYTFNIGAVLNNIVVRSCQNYSTNPAPAVLSGVVRGDLIIATPLEVDTHGQSGLIQPAAKMTDTCGGVYDIALPLASSQLGGLLLYTGTALCSGNVNLVQTLPGGTSPTPLAGVVCDVAGAQPVIDLASVTNAQPSITTASLTNSFTTQVPNMLVMAASAGGTPSLSSPCTTLSTSTSFFAIVTLCAEPAATAGSYSVTSNFSDGGSFEGTTTVMEIFGLRPSVPASGPFTGEKIRRMVN